MASKAKSDPRTPPLQIRRRDVVRAVTYLVLSSVALLWAVPFVWLVGTSLKPDQQLFTRPPIWIPQPILWRNYAAAMTHPGFPFWTLLGYSIFYAVLSTIGEAIAASLVGYGFSRLVFWGRDVLFVVLLATLMIPGVVMLIPTYVLFRLLGWIGTYAPLIVPSYFGSAFYIFLMRQFFLTVPWELTEAAIIDGANELVIFGRIILPQIKPALMVVCVFNFLGCWNDFMGPLIYVAKGELYPLSLGIYAFQTRFDRLWNLQMAAAVVITIPMIMLFFAAQRAFIEGMTLTGLKG